MTGRPLPPGRHGFDDIAPGDWIETGGHVVTAADIEGFAELSGDRFEIHMDDEAARSRGFPSRVAHGLLVLSIVDGLKNRAAAQFRAVASIGWNWSFREPVFVGDEVGATIAVETRREVSRPDRGILSLGFDIGNQNGTTVQSGSNLLLVYR